MQRVGEVACLKVASIKSQRMLLHIEGSKGGADQYATIAATTSPFDRLSLDLITQDPD